MRLATAVMIAILGSGSPFSLPDECAGWKATGPPAAYDAQSIFRYLDGHGEVYLAYGMDRCLARRYSGPAGEGDIVVDVFEMASSADAFGVFSHSRDGETVPLGQGASLAFGTLLFWKGRYFVSVYAEQESEPARAAVLRLGRSVDGAITDVGELPALLGDLPREGLDASSLVWLRHARILDAHARLGPGNLLGVGASVPAALARYARDGESAQLALVAYPDLAAADAATSRFADHLLGGGAGPTRREDGWYGCTRAVGAAATRAFVLRASSQRMAESLLARFREGRTP
jgi:hypothetical protein